MKTMVKAEKEIFRPGEEVRIFVAPGPAATVRLVNGIGRLKRLGYQGNEAVYLLAPHTPLIEVGARAPGYEEGSAVLKADTELEVMPNSIFESLVMAMPLWGEPVEFPNRLGPKKRSVLDLSGTWKAEMEPEQGGLEFGYHLPEFDDSSWRPVRVPGNLGLQWPESVKDFEPVWLRKELHWKPLKRDCKAFLVFHGVDYFAEVYLNGKPLDRGGMHEGYFNPFKFDVTDSLVPGRNLVAVKVTNPWDYGIGSAYEHGYTGACEKVWIKGVLSYHDTRPGSINLSAAEVQSNGTCGIVQPVELVSTGQVSLDWVRLSADYDPQAGEGKLAATAVLFNHSGEGRDVVLAFRLKGRGFEHYLQKAVALKVPPGPWRTEVLLEVPSARPWWPASHPELGRPELYDFELQVHDRDAIVDHAEEIVGFRRIELDDSGWRLNGKRLFLKGANVIPTIYIGEMSEGDYRELLKSVTDANLDSIIVLDHHQPRIFYRLCDEIGVVVLQEFTLVWEYSTARHERPCGDAGLVDNVEVIKRMLNEALLLYESHPSIVWWSLHDEPFYTFGVPLDTGVGPMEKVFTKDDVMPLLMDSSGNRDLDQVLYETAVSVERQRPVHKTGNEGTESTTYYGWYTGSYKDVAEADFRLPIEYGAQAVPFKAEEFIRSHGRDMWPVTGKEAARAWMYRCLQLPYLSARIGRTTDYETFADWAFASQMYQALVLKHHTEYLRLKRYSPTISLHYFILSSYWPSSTWAVMDDDGRRMPGYYWAAGACSPILALVQVRDHVLEHATRYCFELWVVNDTHEPLRGGELAYTLTRRSECFLVKSDPGCFEEGFRDMLWSPRGLKHEVIVLGGTFDDVGLSAVGRLGVDVPPDSLIKAGVLEFETPGPGAGPAYLHLELEMTDRRGRKVSGNWYDFAVMSAADIGAVGRGITPLPRFDLIVEAKPYTTVTVERLFSADAWSSRVESGESGEAVLRGMLPGVYALRWNRESREVALYSNVKQSIE